MPNTIQGPGFNDIMKFIYIEDLIYINIIHYYKNTKLATKHNAVLARQLVNFIHITFAALRKKRIQNIFE